MDWELIVGVVLGIALLIIIAVVAKRNMNHNYTIGSGMFKMSDDNLEKDKHVDTADYNYYDNDGIMK